MPSLREYYESGQAAGEAAGEAEERIRIVRAWSQSVHGDVIDIGCNDGRLAALLRGPGRKVIGVDLNPDQLRQASSRLDRVMSFDITGPWPVETETVGGIHMGAVIEHVFDYRSMFSEAARVLQSSGKLWISTPNMACLRHRVEVLLGSMPAWYTNYEHIRPWTVEFLDEQLTALGLFRTRLRGAHIKNGPVHRALSQWLPRLSSLFVAEYEKGPREARVGSSRRIPLAC
jgi:SAM-dependent methyltransferase